MPVAKATHSALHLGQGGPLMGKPAPYYREPRAGLRQLIPSHSAHLTRNPAQTRQQRCQLLGQPYLTPMR